MSSNNKTVKIATIQAEPVWNDLQGGVDKAIALIKEAGKNGANHSDAVPVALRSTKPSNGKKQMRGL